MDHIAACNYNNVHNLLASSSAGQEQYFLSLLEFQQDMYTMNLSTLLPILLTLGFCYSAILERNSNQKSQDNPVHPTVSWRKLSKTIQRQPQLKVNPLISSIASKGSSFEISVRLFGKSQVFLQIAADGTVNGTVDCTSKYAELKMQSVGAGNQRIKAVNTNRYLAMDKKGNLYSTTTLNDETIFRQAMHSTAFHTFASAKFYRVGPYDTYVSIGRNGKARNGATTNLGQNKVKFVIFTADRC
ncbi:fibroblast growth factor 2-like [Acropora muricata]|uniref:fibroblast growth factor 2-like n=1 Tax=Acropora millepora TaxID=45264 RepID=UPI0010FCCEC6|nr:fibroblast growth factor 2-like [Acropora millepora]